MIIIVDIGGRVTVARRFPGIDCRVRVQAPRTALGGSRLPYSTMQDTFPGKRLFSRLPVVALLSERGRISCVFLLLALSSPPRPVYRRASCRSLRTMIRYYM